MRPYVTEDEPSRGFVLGITIGAVFWLVVVGIVIAVTK